MYRKEEKETPEVAYARANHELLKKIEKHLSDLVAIKMNEHLPVGPYDAIKNTETREQGDPWA